MKYPKNKTESIIQQAKLLDLILMIVKYVVKCFVGLDLSIKYFINQILNRKISHHVPLEEQATHGQDSPGMHSCCAAKKKKYYGYVLLWNIEIVKFSYTQNDRI